MTGSSAKKRVGILISGRGSNMEALIAAARLPAYPATIAVVISNNAGAPGLEKARSAGLKTAVVNHRDFQARPAFERALTNALESYAVELVCNAGFMRLLTATFVDHWKDRQLNIHPSLLPAFRGLDTHARALGAGVKVTGCTVHIVREEMDAGPIIAQAAVPILPGDTPDRLADRVLAAEHQLYPHALAMIASGAHSVVGERVEPAAANATPDTASAPPTLIVPPLPSGPMSHQG